MAWALCNMGGAKCQPFQKHTYVVTIGKRPLKMIFKGSVCFRRFRVQFPEAGATTYICVQQKKAHALPQHGSLQVLAVS